MAAFSSGSPIYRSLGAQPAAALSRLFGALVLGLFFAERSGERLLWVAGGLLVLGLGSLGFGYMVVLLVVDPDLNTAAYQSLVVWTVAGALFAVGLLSKAPPRFRWRPLALSLAVLGAAGVIVHGWASVLPLLAPVASPESAVAVGRDLPGTTNWHLALSTIPLGLTVAATLGAASGYRSEAVPGWLLVAMTLFAGTQLHNLFWPSVYSSVLATADVLGLTFAAVVVLGGIFELRSAAAERAALLADEKERARRLGELATLKADFTAMVVHELVGPLSAVRRLADVLDRFGASDPELRAQVVGGIRKETDDLMALVADVRATATVERDDFEVKLRPVRLAGLLEEARTYARALPGDHLVGVSFATALGEGWCEPTPGV